MRSTEYTMCLHCDHFVEPNDVDDAEGIANGWWAEGELAPYVHLDNGEKDHDHNAEPNFFATMSLADWRHTRPALFTRYADGQIGPNSVHYTRKD